MSDILLREQEIKIALIDWLFRKGLLLNSTIINEMVVANWSRRVDLAVAGKYLYAYEIKSDFDSLKRLNGQLEIFTSVFDKVTVVCSPKYTKDVLKKIDNNVEVIEYSSTARGVKFKVIKRGSLNIITDKKIFFSFLLKSELRNLIKNQCEISGLGSMDRATLEGHAYKVSIKRIRDFVVFSLKNRYEDTSRKYIDLVSNDFKPNVDNLCLLSKYKKNKIDYEFYSGENIKIEDSVYYEADIGKLASKYGENSGIPYLKVIKRKVKKGA